MNLTQISPAPRDYARADYVGGGANRQGWAEYFAFLRWAARDDASPMARLVYQPIYGPPWP